jgi:phenylacetate-coenzyme A ligase PaaK-like adenylate-forming protein
MLKLLIALIQVMIDSGRSVASLEKIKNKRLKAILISAYDNVPYYKKLMEDVNYNPSTDFTGMEDLSKLPLLTKKILKSNESERFIHQDYNNQLTTLFNDSTSGSTGVPLIIYRSTFERALQIAKWLRVLFKNGYLPTQKVLSFTSPARLSEGKSLLQKFGLLRRFAVDYNLPASESLKAIEEYKPEVVYGNRSSFDLLFDEMEKSNASISYINFVIMTGECVHESTKSKCRALFNIEPVETYGSVEMGIMAYGIQGQKGLILNNDLTHFEFLKSDGTPAQAGELARIVVTDLSAKIQPFLRYEQGDQVVFEDMMNKSGEIERKIVKIVGRDDDVATLSDGSRITFLKFYEALDVFLGLNQFRVIQTEFDKFEVLLVTDKEYFEQNHNEISQRLAEYCSQDVTYELKLVTSIPQDPNGKIRFLISEVETKNGK